LRDHCLLHERRVLEDVATGSVPVFAEETEAVRRAFERLKPSVASREKRLEDGDYLNMDLLVEYLVERRRDPAPPVRFYERPRINRRDLSVLLLLDVSGSTGEHEANRRILDIEKQAALILGSGLESLGDPFSICGFSGEGRENCEYLVFKEFEEKWDSGAAARVYAARPLSSTRIGVALRHSGMRLNQQRSRRRLLIVITDGRPMDAGYDAKTRYAQYDVRMACHENERQEVHTFAISTEENSRRDMEIMFPGRQFLILPSIAELPRVLPRLYIAMTT
jgi:nitric oxide reductase activation protein